MLKIAERGKMITDYRKAYQEELNKEKELGKTINSQLIEIADLKNKLISGELVYKDLRDSSNTEIAELQDKNSRRNMQIKELKPYKDLVEQILNMTNIHGVYKDDTDCINSIREAISRK